MKATIVIPSYWRGPAAAGSACGFESDFIYESASPLDSEGTLGQALESLDVLRDKEDVSVAVVAVPTRDELKQAVELRVQTIVAQFEHKYPIMVIGPEEIMLWRRRLASKGLYQYDHFLSLDGCANVRNVCLLASVLSSAEAAVIFDEGAALEDPEYIFKALEFVGGQHDGGFVGGVTGHFRHTDGSPLLPLSMDGWQGKWGGIDSMNRALSLISEGPRLKKAPFTFGGNMVIHQQVFENVPYDPSIPRGEDMDYLMNARLFGYDFYMDSDLWTRRDEPERCAPPWFDLRQDIIRFARERAKLNALADGDAGLSAASAGDFDPFPGRFLRDDLHDIVFETSMEMAGGYYSAGREADAGECIMNIAISRAETGIRQDALAEYVAYQRQWQEFIGIVPATGIWDPEFISD
ncbi:MAG: hypothetical protein C4534_05835 [Gaiellales bacterium]|nr:MAG: hypothetical protein C4534_05835 [Gaiellales bacterium]